MKWKAIFLACLYLLNSYAECKWKNHEKRSHWRENANEINRSFEMGVPPDHTKLIPMARYVLHNSDWASLATISVLPAIEGFPFSNVKSVVDGSLANSTGVPYFYMSPLDFSAKDLSKNNRATVLVSLEETRYCENQKIDAEDPRCTRLMLSGKMKKVCTQMCEMINKSADSEKKYMDREAWQSVFSNYLVREYSMNIFITEGTPEYTFAKAALFERHPAMAYFPPDHNWFVAKLKIVQIAMIDWFGGAKYISVRDYLAYNYTGMEMISHTQRHLQRAFIP